MLVKFADLYFDIDVKYNCDNRKFLYYQVLCNCIPNFKFSYTDLELEAEMKNADFIQNNLPAYAESSLYLRKISEVLPLKSAFMLHSAAFMVDNIGTVFMAPSGTGKTTHLLNWLKVIDNNEEYGIDSSPFNCCLINGDKPFIRFFDDLKSIPQDTKIGIPYVYGNIWNGKENYGLNRRAPLKHICFIERSETNYVTRIDKNDAVSRIMKQVYMPKNSLAMSNTLQLVKRLIASCDLWIIHCNQEPESAKVAYNTIFKF